MTFSWTQCQTLRQSGSYTILFLQIEYTFISYSSPTEVLGPITTGITLPRLSRRSRCVHDTQTTRAEYSWSVVVFTSPVTIRWRRSQKWSVNNTNPIKQKDLPWTIYLSYLRCSVKKGEIVRVYGNSYSRGGRHVPRAGYIPIVLPAFPYVTSFFIFIPGSVLRLPRRLVQHVYSFWVINHSIGFFNPEKWSSCHF